MGFLGLTFYERFYTKEKLKQSILSKLFSTKELETKLTNTRNQSISYTITNIFKENSKKELEKDQSLTFRAPIYELISSKYAMMIAIGVGFHNFSEGLLFGQSFLSGSIELSLILFIGFASHSALMGFGIACPITCSHKKTSIGFVILLGLIGSIPMTLGTIIGSLWISSLPFILFMSIAAGTIMYVTMSMYYWGRNLISNNIMIIGVFIGICLGVISNLLTMLLIHPHMNM